MRLSRPSCVYILLDILQPEQGDQNIQILHDWGLCLLWICLHPPLPAHSHTHLHSDTHTHTHIHAHTSIQTHTCTHLHTDTHTHTCTHTHLHTDTHITHTVHHNWYASHQTHYEHFIVLVTFLKAAISCKTFCELIHHA